VSGWASEPHVRAHVTREAEVVRSAVARLPQRGALCAIGITYVDGALPWFDLVGALPVEERTAWFEKRGEQALWSLWCPAAWAVRLAAADMRIDEQARTRSAREVRRSLRKAGIDDPVGEVGRAVARALTDEPPPVPITEDFLVFATEHEMVESMFEDIRSDAPARIVAAYERRGWLQFPDEFLE
jgi:hypothetical protein